MTRALIIGGGIAGTITAIALHEAGHEPLLFEAYDRTAEGVGAFLTLAVNGLDALLPLGLKDVVKSAGFDSPRMALRLGDGTRLAEFPLGRPLPDGTVSQTVLRSDLYVALRDEAARRGIHAEYGKRLIDASETSSQVTAEFADGTTASGDLLVGADGLRSRVRTIIDPQAPSPRYVPLLNTGGFAEGLALEDEPGVLTMTFGKRVFFCHVVSPDGRVWWFANPPRRTEPAPAELATLAGDKLRAELLDMVSRDRTRAAEIIRATRTLYPAWPTYDFPTVPVWHRGRMVIIGDAAHATSPAAGQGASMAIEDAVTLGKCLRDVPDVTQALVTYERLRRERVEAVVARGKRNGDDKVTGPLGRIVRDFFLRRAFAKPSAGEDPNAFMWDHHIDWAAPVAG
jgi:2-polyprenyl-6-methoxyphenol hydroxylase-like FAD-dependent oxidoreductase